MVIVLDVGKDKKIRESDDILIFEVRVDEDCRLENGFI